MNCVTFPGSCVAHENSFSVKHFQGSWVLQIQLYFYSTLVLS